jgi:ATPase subunit of ABC transporter with duplicated ATPase domains
MGHCGAEVLEGRRVAVLVVAHIPTTAALERAPAVTCPAGLLIVSHDQYLLQSVVKELYVVGDGTVRHFEGDFLEYKKTMATAAWK